MRGYNDRMKRFRFGILLWTAATVLGFGLAAGLSAQETDHHAKSAVPSTELTITGAEGNVLVLTPDVFAALPHKEVSVFNAHSKANEKYSGVPLIELLAKVGVPQGEQMKGKAFLTGVVAEGTDHYDVLFALGEIDPSVHTGEVLVADSVNGQKLGKDGVFKMVSTEEKRPARWVRNLSSLKVVAVAP